MKFAAPITALAVSADNRKLVVGTVEGGGTVVVRNRASRGAGSSAVLGVTGGTGEASLPLSRPGAAAAQSDEETGHSSRGRLYQGAGLAVEGKDDAVLETTRPVRLKPYENHLRKFQYQSALDAALHTHNPLVVVTVLEELSRRSGLKIALSGRDETSLEPLLSFLARYITHPRNTILLAQVAHMVLDLYGSVLGLSDTIDVLMHKLHTQVKAELAFHKQIMRVVGSLDGIINAASISRVAVK